jgi:pyruvate carboxylase
LQDRQNPETGPPLDCSNPCEIGWRNIIVKQGPEAFAKAVRQYPGTLIMDTTWRDAHQSLLATRLRTIDMVNIARETSYALANAYSLECWGGATFDVAMRFLYEDPWERLVRVMDTILGGSADFIPIEDIEEARSEHPFAGTRSWSQCRWLYQLSVSFIVLGLTSMLRISSDNAIYDFCKKSVENGLDIFRVFDSLNYIGM